MFSTCSQKLWKISVKKLNFSKVQGFQLQMPGSNLAWYSSIQCPTKRAHHGWAQRKSFDLLDSRSLETASILCFAGSLVLTINTFLIVYQLKLHCAPKLKMVENCAWIEKKRLSHNHIWQTTALLILGKCFYGLLCYYIFMTCNNVPAKDQELFREKTSLKQGFFTCIIITT